MPPLRTAMRRRWAEVGKGEKRGCVAHQARLSRVDGGTPVGFASLIGTDTVNVQSVLKSRDCPVMLVPGK